MKFSSCRFSWFLCSDLFCSLWFQFGSNVNCRWRRKRRKRRRKRSRIKYTWMYSWQIHWLQQQQATKPLGGSIISIPCRSRGPIPTWDRRFCRRPGSMTSSDTFLEQMFLEREEELKSDQIVHRLGRVIGEEKLPDGAVSFSLTYCWSSLFGARLPSMYDDLSAKRWWRVCIYRHVERWSNGQEKSR